MFKRTKQLIKANALLKEELMSLEKEYKKKEQEINNSNRLMSEMNMGYIQYLSVTDEEGNLIDLLIEYASDAICSNSRLQDKILISEPISKVLPGFYEDLLKVSREAMTTGNRTAFIHYDQVEDHYIKVICFGLGEDRGVSTFIDITDSFYTEKLLEDREEWYRSALELTDQYVFELDLEGKFTYISEGIDKMLGYDPEEYLGRFYYEQYPPDVRDHTAHMFQKRFKECGQEIHGLMTELIGKDGRHHYTIQNGIVLMDEDGNDVGYRGIYLDITAIQMAKKKAEEVAHTKSEILTKMGHEIRTPLNEIIGLTSLALEEPRTCMVYRYLERMQENTRGLLEDINSVLACSKIEREECRLYEEAFSLQVVLNKVVDMLLNKAHEKGINLSIEKEQHVADTYSGNRIRLEQILTNLLTSAIKNTREGEVKLIIRRREKGLLFIIKDSGAGMTKEEIKHIFSRSRSDLLFLISKQLIEAMEGKIKVFSREQKGTKVYVALPLKLCGEDLVRSTESEYLRKRKVQRYKRNVLEQERDNADLLSACDGFTSCTREGKKEEQTVSFLHIDHAIETEHREYGHAIYNKIVFTFIKEYQDDVSHFKELVCKDQKAARIYIHTLKAASRDVGAMRLSALADQLDEMLLSGKIEKALVERYSAELSAVLSELIPYAESVTMERYTRGYREEQAYGLIKTIQCLIKSHSAAVVELIAEIYGTFYRKDLVESVESLVSQIEEYEFEKAEATLATIQKSLGVNL